MTQRKLIVTIHAGRFDDLVSVTPLSRRSPSQGEQSASLAAPFQNPLLLFAWLVERFCQAIYLPLADTLVGCGGLAVASISPLLNLETG